MSFNVIPNIIPLGPYFTEEASEEEVRGVIEKLRTLYTSPSALKNGVIVEFKGPVTIINGDVNVILREYSFVVTRQWRYYGDICVGGAAGEALNLDGFFRHMLIPFQ